MRNISLKKVGISEKEPIENELVSSKVSTMDLTTLRGCMLVVNIGEYGISKAIRSGDNLIEFTADKVGTFPINCNMRRGDGKLIVESS